MNMGGKSISTPKTPYECIKDSNCTGINVCRANKCVDPCTGITCAAGKKCNLGTCTACPKGDGCGCSSPAVSNGGGGCIDPCSPNRCDPSTPTCTRNSADYSCTCTASSCGAGKQCAGTYCSNCSRGAQCGCPSGQLANGSGGCGSVTCSSDSACGAGKQCGNPGSLDSYCYSCAANTQCSCPSGQVSNGSGGCSTPSCSSNTICGPGKQCNDAGKYNAKCESCAGNTQCTCPGGQLADGSGGCKSADPCAGVTCTAGKKCVGGVCTNCANGESIGCNCPTKADSSTGKSYRQVATGYGSCRHACQSQTCKNSGQACLPLESDDSYYFSPTNPYNCSACACDKDCEKFGNGSQCMKRKGSSSSFCYTPCHKDMGPNSWGESSETGCWTGGSEASRMYSQMKNNSYQSYSFCGWSSSMGGGGYSSNPYGWNGEACFSGYESSYNNSITYTFEGVSCTTQYGYTSGGYSCAGWAKNGYSQNNVCWPASKQKDYYSSFQTEFVCGLDGGRSNGGNHGESPTANNMLDYSGSYGSGVPKNEYERLTKCPTGHPNSYY